MFEVHKWSVKIKKKKKSEQIANVHPEVDGISFFQI